MLRNMSYTARYPGKTSILTKDVEEFFAESFRFYMMGIKLPKRINAAMEKTFERAIRKK